MDDNDELRKMEIESITSIYPDIITTENDNCIVLNLLNICFIQFDLPNSYPSTNIPIITISGPLLSRTIKDNINKKLQSICMNNKGNPLIYECIEGIKDDVSIMDNLKEMLEENNQDEREEVKEQKIDFYTDIPDVLSGDILTDRKSVFQGHIAKVNNIDDINKVLWQLKQIKKIAQATHNMYAYRYNFVKNGKTYVAHDCDDDGETAAGSKMAQVLELMKCENVLVVVSRWYGGINLGPDRFRHICNVTRDIVNEYLNRNK
uniref:RWD domain-containing protein n=1 Tax=Parastrongyloides trichosuri TaxID=131310 RepID=A0A0N4Z1A3_PARTI